MRTSSIHLVAEDNPLSSLLCNLLCESFEFRDLDLIKEVQLRVLWILLGPFKAPCNVHRLEVSPFMRRMFAGIRG
jgi:hypothetical protein